MMRRLSHQLLLWFIMIALVPFAIVASGYAGAERALRAEVTNGLFAIARRQVDAIGAVVRPPAKRNGALALALQPTRFGRWSGRCARRVRSLLPTLTSIGGSGRF
jgi:hypothetical protein